MRKRTKAAEIDLKKILATQKVLDRRLLWLFTLPFLITAVVVFMFFSLSTRVTEVEVGTKLVAIERFLADDKNHAWAIDQYERIAQTHPSAPIFARLGTLYFLLDRKHENLALEKLEKARHLDPNYWETYRSLSFIYSAMGRPKDAVEAGQRALALNENDANTYNNLAWIHGTSSEPTFADLQRAQEYAEKAVRLTKEKQPDFLDTLAQVYFNRGDHTRALDCLRKAKAAADDDVRKIQGHFKKLFPNETL